MFLLKVEEDSERVGKQQAAGIPHPGESNIKALSPPPDCAPAKGRAEKPLSAQTTNLKADRLSQLFHGSW